MRESAAIFSQLPGRFLPSADLIMDIRTLEYKCISCIILHTKLFDVHPGSDVSHTRTVPYSWKFFPYLRWDQKRSFSREVTSSFGRKSMVYFVELIVEGDLKKCEY